MKKFLISASLLLLASLCAAAVGCTARAEFSDDVSCTSIGERIRGALEEKEYANLDRSALNDRLDTDGEYDGYYYAYSTDTSDVDEVGVFHATSEEEARELEEDLEEYVDTVRKEERAFLESYAPEELPKLDAAEVRRFGRYVAFAVLDGDTAEGVFDKIKDALKK